MCSINKLLKHRTEEAILEDLALLPDSSATRQLLVRQWCSLADDTLYAGALDSLVQQISPESTRSDRRRGIDNMFASPPAIIIASMHDYGRHYRYAAIGRFILLSRQLLEGWADSALQSTERRSIEAVSHVTLCHEGVHYFLSQVRCRGSRHRLSRCIPAVLQRPFLWHHLLPAY
jgi:hypothetical protein